MDEKKKIAPRDTWNKLSITEMIDIKNDLLNYYYDAMSAGATYANQFLLMSKEAEQVINQKYMQDEIDKQKQSEENDPDY